VALGKESLDPEIRQQLAENIISTPSVTLLTQREKEALQLLAQGRRNSEISQQLHISIKTVETHLTSLYQKLGVQSRAEAISTAQQQRSFAWMTRFRHLARDYGRWPETLAGLHLLAFVVLMLHRFTLLIDHAS
jgi:DNA-binding CsgD family transcriptional regulator